MTFNPRADVLPALDLASIETPDGVFRFIVGTDGIFTDVNGDQWFGSRLIMGSDLKASIQGEAPSGSLTLSFIPDPSGDDIIAQIRELGSDYVRGRKVVFWDQPLLSMEEFYAPSLPPRRLITRTAMSIGFDMSGALERSITLHFESASLGRNSAPGLRYNTNDHSALIGFANASTRLMPTDGYQEEKLFG